ncbi:MAG TPA: TorF family putative porin [Allosphingosinicella sp.]|nr:TorF family putative porin [Allosphingosinicella sp.]
MRQSPLRRLALAAFAATAFAAPAFAQDEQEPAGGDGGLDISATVTGVTDYRFRGVSSSDRDPAIQGSVDVNYHGFYIGAWASSIARTADTNVELDLYAGYAGSAGPVEYEVGAIAYLYPGGDGTGNIYEGTASLSYTLGPVTGKLSANYAPDQENLAGDNLYLNAELRSGIPTTPLTIFASVGRERGSFYGRKWDWSLGFEFSQGPFTASLAYVDTNLDSDTHFLGRNIRAGIVASAGFTF